ncbi:MAG: hypothetical protein CMQ16_12415 [Gammaproteobacteria bacterium]|nr:hypothetical protein [Gammaproteobacteria bacterium]
MTYINNPAAYEAAKQRRIRMNAKIGRQQRWLAVAGNQELSDFLMESGEYSPVGYVVRYEDGTTQRISTEDYKAGKIEERPMANMPAYLQDYKATAVTHPVVKASSGDFYKKMVDALEEYGALTEGQTKAVSAMLARSKAKIAEWSKADQERAVNAEDCPTGRVEITGKVLNLTLVENSWGETCKMLVEADQGFRVYGTAPAEAEKGETITFTATVTPSDRDAKFGFFKRPRIVKQKGAA